MSNSIFESKKPQTKLRRIAIKMEPELANEIESIQADLASKNPDLKFNVNEIAVDAIRKAVKKARKELSAMS